MKKFLRRVLRRVKKEDHYNPNIHHVYTDKKGNKWYAYEDLMDMGILRKTQLEEIQNYAEANITKDSLKIFIKNGLEAVDNNDKDHLKKLFYALDMRMDFVAARRPYIDLTSALYMLEDEDPIKLDKDAFRKKQEILSEDEDAQNFFFRHLLRSYRNFTEDYEQRLLDFLMEFALWDQITEQMMRKKSPKMLRKKKTASKQKKDSSENSPSKTES